MKKRNYIQARNLLKEAKEKFKDYDSIIGRTHKDYEALRKTGILCKAFSINGNTTNKIVVTRQCWNHIFKHPIKRPSKIEKLERALCMPMAIKLLKKTTTYQEVSREKDKGGNEYLFFGIIGYVRGNRIKVIIRKQEKNTNAKYVLFSFFQMSSAPIKKETENKKS
jgi:hypothetical protein